MPKFRKKPVEIEAQRFDGENADDLCKWIGPAGWAGSDAVDGTVVMIETLEGQMKAVAGDWIIRGVEGEFYPCKPAIFAATYEPA